MLTPSISTIEPQEPPVFPIIQAGSGNGSGNTAAPIIYAGTPDEQPHNVTRLRNEIARILKAISRPTAGKDDDEDRRPTAGREDDQQREGGRIC